MKIGTADQVKSGVTEELHELQNDVMKSIRKYIHSTRTEHLKDVAQLLQPKTVDPLVQGLPPLFVTFDESRCLANALVKNDREGERRKE